MGNHSFFSLEECFPSLKSNIQIKQYVLDIRHTDVFFSTSHIAVIFFVLVVKEKYLEKSLVTN